MDPTEINRPNIRQLANSGQLQFDYKYIWTDGFMDIVCILSHNKHRLYIYSAFGCYNHLVCNNS